MRTSNKLFLGALALLGMGLAIYDVQLNAAFRTSDYTKPFYNYEPLAFTGFDRIRLNSSTALNILLVQGDFQVKANPRMHDWLQVEQVGTQLVITAHFPDHVASFPYDYSLYISCPRLKEIVTTGQFVIRGKPDVDSSGPRPWTRPTKIAGFTLDSLHLAETDGGYVVLDSNRIGTLHATVNTGSELILEPGNSVRGGDISVLGRGQLTLKDLNNIKLNHYLSDSATLNINGAAAKQLLKLNQP